MFPRVQSERFMTVHMCVHDLHEYILACDKHPCYSWLMRQVLQEKQGISNSMRIGKNLPIMGKSRHRNRFKYRQRNRRNLETLAGVLGMNIVFMSSLVTPASILTPLST